ncbi:MAG: 2-oxoacid:ferredoxin oxidoreductase subunit gamma [Ignavibacteria bacterium CG_4_9_14_3_um_filter_36_18]|nr:2-oxoacid:ferredoxin oxidoreductase subunit gamma [Ignavibacteria bacterium]PJB01378.1 MAG: 2-oxoacid:ferredoxin oxidoreductase subunit gamma [Ignavibacteria bacterium CG_4_9_14_3_um_filter_36_18]
MEKAHEIIFAGFGGQGVLSMGQVIAYAAMIENKEVSWMPSYGPEMRGGTANCTVIVSPNRISSPTVSKYDSAVVLNQPSLEKFESCVKPGGLLLYEESTIVTPPSRTDIEVIVVPGNEEALKLNKKQVANMILLGAFLEKVPLVSIDSILKALKKVLPERHHHLIPINEQALIRGKEIAKLTEHV